MTANTPAAPTPPPSPDRRETPSANSHQPSAIGHPPSANSHQPSANSHQPSAIGHPPSATGHPPSAIRHPPSRNPLPRLWADPVGRVLVIGTLIGVCLLGAIVCVFLGLWLVETLGPEVALPLPFGRATTTPLPTQAASDETLVSSGELQVPLAVPQILKFAGLTLPVASVEVNEDGIWQVPIEQKATAFWVHGTVINYVFGLADTQEHQDAIDGLRKGDSLELQMSDGRALLYQVSQKASVPAQETGMFAQTRPGLTLVLVGGRATTRLVIEAIFVGQSGTSTAPVVSGPVDLGVPAQAGDLKVTVSAVKLVTSGAPELPSGLAYYLVDYTVENTGPGPVEGSLVVTELIDSTGARFAPVIPVSAITTYPPLSGKLDPNSVTDATAAYLVPATFSDTAPTWQFSPEVGSRETARVRLASSTAAGPEISVTLDSASLSADQSELILSGTVVNLGSQSVNVAESDLTILSGAGQAGEFHSATPPLPWTIEPGAFQPYQLAFARPATTSVIFRLLGWEFEISGLQ